MRKTGKMWGALGAFWLGFLLCGSHVQAQEEVVFSGNARATGKNAEITFVFTEHVGGKFDASQMNEGGYYTVEYAGEEGGVYLAFSSASGGVNWTAVYPAETTVTEEGNYISTFAYEDIVNAFGTNFARLDVIHAYSSSASEVRVMRIAYVPGQGDPVDTSDGAWEREKEGIAFVGDSIVQNPIFFYGDWNTILGREDCVNYGIGGQTTVEIRNRFDDVLAGSYEKIVFLCGINDLGQGKQMYVTVSNYRKMLESMEEKLPNARAYIISVLPTTDVFFKDNQDSIRYMNAALENLSKEFDFVTFVDVYSLMVGEDGYCKPEYLSDGLHPNEQGYAVLAEVLNPYLDQEVEDDGQTDADGTEADASSAGSEKAPLWQNMLVGAAGIFCILVIFITIWKMVMTVRRKKK